MRDKARTVAVIGAGIVGVSTAIWLQRGGHRVILIDRAAPGEGASFGNGGVLAACAVVPATEPGLALRAPRMLLDPDAPLFLKWRYLPRLMPWLLRYLSHANATDTERIARALLPIVGDSLADHQSLSAGTGAERHVVPSDYAYAYRDRAAFAGDAYGWGLKQAAGFRWTELEGAAWRDYEPSLSDALRFGVALPGHGRIDDPGAYVKALARHVQKQGGTVLRAEVTDILRVDGRVTGVRAGGETVACDDAVIALGAFSGPLCRALGLLVPLETERGYHIELWEPSVMPRNPLMITAGQFVVTPMEGRLRLAGILELGGLEAPPSRGPFGLLRRAIRKAMPGLTWQRETEWMGHRPAPSDSIPLIGPVPGVAGAWLAFGHHHVGLTGGPKTGRLLAQMVAGGRPNQDMTPYDPARFAR